MGVKKEIIEEKIKKEIPEPVEFTERNRVSIPADVIDVDSTDSDSDSDFDSHDSGIDGIMRKKRKIDFALPLGFLDPLPRDGRMMIPSKTVASLALEAVASPQSTAVAQGCKQFWKAGDYEGDNSGGSAAQSAKEGMILFIILTSVLYTFTFSSFLFSHSFRFII